MAKSEADRFVAKLEKDMNRQLEAGTILCLELGDIITEFEELNIETLEDFIQEVQGALIAAAKDGGLKDLSKKYAMWKKESKRK